MNGKVITQEQIDALQRYFGDSHDGCRHIGYLTEDNQGTAVLLDDLRALYDNAPSLGDSEPFCWAVDCKKEYYDVYNPDERNVIVSDEIFLRDYLEDSNAWIITPLYTTQQPDRVAELEAKLKESIAIINDLANAAEDCLPDHVPSLKSGKFPMEASFNFCARLDYRIKISRGFVNKAMKG